MSTAIPRATANPGASKWTIACDIDDVLWPLNETLAQRLGIPMEKMVEFRYYANPLLTSDQQEALSKGYSDPDIFRHMEFYDGIGQILSVEDLGVKLEFHSNCFSAEVAEIKRQNILRAMTGVREDQLHCKVIDPKQTGQKKLPDGMLVFIDDSPYNVAISTAKFNILPRWPNNITDAARATMAGKDFCYVQAGNIPQLVTALRLIIPDLLSKYGPTPL